MDIFILYYEKYKYSILSSIFFIQTSHFLSKSLMATQSNLPALLTDSDIAALTQYFDCDLNSSLLFSQVFGEHCLLKLRYLNKCSILNMLHKKVYTLVFSVLHCGMSVSIYCCCVHYVIMLK